MTRLLVLLVAFSFAVPIDAQDKIHRALQIDLEQDRRLDAIESRIETLVQSLKVVGDKLDRNGETLVAQSVLEAPKPIADPVPNAEKKYVEEPRYCIGDVKYCEGRLRYLACVNGQEKWLPVPAPSIQLATSQPVVQASTVTYSQPMVVSATTVQQSVVQSSRYAMNELRALIQQHRPRGGLLSSDHTVRPRSDVWRHLKSTHGFTDEQIASLGETEALILHSLAHDGLASPHRSSVSMQSAPVYTYQSSQPVINVQPVRTPVRTVIQAAANGCPNGQCPTQRSNSGWSLFGRWR